MQFSSRARRLVLVLIAGGVFFLAPVAVSASTLYSTGDATFIYNTQATTTTSNDNYYVRAVAWSGVNSNYGLFHASSTSAGVTLGTAPATLRLFRYSGVGCGSITAGAYDTNAASYGTLGAGSTTTVSGVTYCDFPFSAAPTSTQTLYTVLVTVGGASPRTEKPMQLLGSPSNTGYIAKGTSVPDPQAGGFAFQVCDSGGCASNGFGGIDWSAISFPLVEQSAAAGIASSSPLWSAINIASSTTQCQTGNLFADGLCSATAYMFMPNPLLLDAFSGLASSTLPQKFPFSWVYQVQAAIDSLQASSSTNFQAAAFNFHDLGVGSTTAVGNVLPDFQALSTTTIQAYMPAGTWSTIQTMIAGALWLSLGVYIFFEIRNRLHRV